MGKLQDSLKANYGLEFRQIADQICGVAHRYGKKVIGYYSPELPYFHALSHTEQEDVLENLKAFLHSMEVTEEMGGRLDSQKQALWCALSTRGLVPPADLFSHIGENDEVIEIYNLKGLQIWRNFNFFEICSYTLEEIYAIEWGQRYRRSEEKNAECLGKISALLSGEEGDIHYANVAEHEIEETRSAMRFVVEARHDILCRLRDKSGNFVAWMVISKARLARRLEFRRPPLLQVIPSPEI